MKKRHIERQIVGALLATLTARHPLLAVLVGARQTGKTTAADQAAARWRGPVVRAAADRTLPPGPEWIETHWRRARNEAQARRGQGRVLLLLDEIQKVRGWSETVKALWDEDGRSGHRVRPILLGSSALLVQEGLAESLAGRFFLHRSPHWSYPECHAAFGWSLDRWLFHGGYPGAAALLPDEDAWRRYVTDSLVETAIARDVLQLQTVAKPALLRHLFGLAAQHPAEILSYNKMLGSLQDAGNTVTLAHYLRLLSGAFLVSGLDRSTVVARKRGSSPKIVFWNSALVTAISGQTFRESRADPAGWGRLVENAVGAHLLNHLSPPRYAVGYWREGNDEMDFTVSAGRRLIGIEVKSGRTGRLSGLAAFRKRFPKAEVRVIGPGFMELDEFFSADPAEALGLA